MLAFKGSLGRDSCLPSLDDWGSCGASCGRTALGILCHDILAATMTEALPIGETYFAPGGSCFVPRLFQEGPLGPKGPSGPRAFLGHTRERSRILGEEIWFSESSWSVMLDNNAQQGQQNSSDEQRKRTQKKAWRSRCVLTDERRRLSIVLMSYLAAPLERLQAELTEGDLMGKKVFDVFFEDELNPFFQARLSLAKLVSADLGGVWNPVFSCFRLAFSQAEFLNRVRQLGLDLSSQCYWRFMKYADFPFLFVLWAHPRATQEQRDAVINEFYRTRECCRGKEFSEKVFAMFPTAERLTGVRRCSSPRLGNLPA